MKTFINAILIFFKKLRDKLFLNAVRDIIDKEINSAVDKLYLQNSNFEQRFNHNDWISEYLVTARVSRLFTVYLKHQKAFKDYKNKFIGKKIVLMGTGPSLNKFDIIEDAIYIGINRAFEFNKVSFDFLFASDWRGICDFVDDFFDYHIDKCIKFIGANGGGERIRIPSIYMNKKNTFEYVLKDFICDDSFTFDIDTEPLANGASTSLQAMQFALFTNPKKIYLVGIDCSDKGHFIGEKYCKNPPPNTEEDSKFCISASTENWKKISDFVCIYYPNTEIVSVNPVNLRGVFKDWDQDKGDEPK